LIQNTDPDEHFGNLRGGGRLHEDHMFGEVVANVLANNKIASSAVYWDKFRFENQVTYTSFWWSHGISLVQALDTDDTVSLVSLRTIIEGY
jgi:hypothetical protein